MKNFLLLLFLSLLSFTTSKSIKSKNDRSPVVRLIRDKVLDTIIINRVRRHDKESKLESGTLKREHHDVEEAITLKRNVRDLHIGNDKDEAAKIRHLIFFGEPHIRKVRQSIEKRKDVLHKLDQSIEDKWKISQSAHSLNNKQVKASKKHFMLPFSAVAARVMVPVKSPGLSIEPEDEFKESRDEKRDIHLPVKAYNR